MNGDVSRTYGERVLTSLFGFLALAAIAMAMGILDRRLWGTVATPGFLMFGGYVVVAGIYALARVPYDFVEVGSSTYLVVAGFGVAVMGASQLSARVLRWQASERMTVPLDQGVASRIALLGVLAIFVPLATLTAFSTGGLWSVDSKAALSTGPIAHGHVVLAFATIWYSVTSTDPPRLRLGILMGAFAALTLYPVKGWTMIPLAAVVIGGIIRGGGRAIMGLYALALVLGGTAMFFGVYVVAADWGQLDLEVVTGLGQAVFENFVFYLTAGFIGLNAVIEGLRLNGGLETVLAPFVNAGRFVTGGNYVSVVSDTYVPGMAGHPTGGNVFSFLGSLLAHLGMVKGLFLAATFVLIGYLGFGVAWRTRAGGLRAAALYLCGISAFGWFDYYFWLPNPYEVTLFGLVVAVPVLLQARREGAQPATDGTT